MSEERKSNRSIMSEGFFIAITMVFFIALISWSFAATPGLVGQITAFSQSFLLEPVPNTSVSLPAPATPAAYFGIYVVASWFCLAWGIFEIFLLILRFAVRSYSWRKVHAFTHIIWWFGAYYLVTLFLNVWTTLTLWFAFWGALFMLLGAELIIRGLILAALARLK